MPTLPTPGIRLLAVGSVLALLSTSLASTTVLPESPRGGDHGSSHGDGAAKPPAAPPTPAKPGQKPAATKESGHGTGSDKTSGTKGGASAPAKSGKSAPEPSTPKSDPAHDDHGHPSNDPHAASQTTSGEHGGEPGTAAADPHASNAADDHGAGHAAHEPVAGVSADTALRRLIEGNARFAHNFDNQTPRDIDRRATLAGGQQPFAIVLTCADSRVPPELVFDQDLGDLFVVRVAGNTADDAILGSMEYAIEHLGSRLIVVMGHSKCGAVKAAVDTAKSGKTASDLPGHLPAVVADIMPAVHDVKDQPGDAVRAAVMRNVQRTVASLKRCGPVIQSYVETKGLKVVGAVYDLETGEVDLVPELSPAAPAAQTVGAGESKQTAPPEGGHDGH